MSLGAWFFAPTARVPLGWFLATVAASVLLVATFWEAAWKAHQYALKPLPSVRFAVDEVARGKGLVLVLDESGHFSTGIAVSVFIAVQEDYEALLGTGFVETIHDNGRIQVRIVTLAEGHEEQLKKVRRNDASVLRALRVKPSLIWQQLATGGQTT